MVFVWRMENKDKRGPYQSNAMSISQPSWMESSHETENGHPCAHETQEESLRRRWYRKNNWIVRKRWRYGFRTLKQAKDWFSPVEIDNLAKLGFELKKKKAKRAIHGVFQSVFIPTEET